MIVQPDYAARARDLVGCAFRPQGRDARFGLDCVGLTIAVYEIPDEYRRDYRLAGNHRRELHNSLQNRFRAITRRKARPGDLMLWSPSPDQMHLGVWTGGSFVHADAGIRKIVETPGTPSWRLLRVYRKRTRQRRNV